MNYEFLPWLRLWHLRNVSYKHKRKLVEELGSAEAVFAAPKSRIVEVIEDAEVAAVIVKGDDRNAFASDVKWLKCDNHLLIPITHQAYPSQLKEIADPPLVLYVHGNAELLAYHQLAIVGSRNPTPLGRETAFDFAASLVHRGFAITSGMALGIDAAAHRGALNAGGTTIAVAATGLDIVYPRTNQRLADDIADNGVIVSEFAIGMPPRRDNFPRRNRIISGLAVGTLVVEAAARSGSLITARLAGEQSREVFAIPGSIHSPNARGCHQLIKQGAKLVETTDDIMSEFAWLTTQQTPQNTAKGKNSVESLLESAHKNLLEYIDFAPTSVDNIIERSGLTAETVSSILLQLELRGLVQAAPGGHYTRMA